MKIEKTESKWVEAVAKMIKLTQGGKLRWDAQPGPVSVGAVRRFAYVTHYKDHILRLYDMGNDLDRALNRPSATLEFIDEHGNTLWTYPNVESLNHLLSSVEFQIADVKDFLEEILSEA